MRAAQEEAEEPAPEPPRKGTGFFSFGGARPAAKVVEEVVVVEEPPAVRRSFVDGSCIAYVRCMD